MSILVGEDTTVIVQGIGSQGTFHARRNADYGTKIAAGVHPKRGGETWSDLDVPVYANAKEARQQTGADASMVMVPAPFAADAILEAADAGIELIVCITEGIPVHDMARVYNTLYERTGEGEYDKSKGPVLVGPNCPGLISPGKANIGIIPSEITSAGNVGLVSRSGTLTYQIMHELAVAGIGISTCVGIGGDPIIGSDFLDIIPRFVDDDGTEAIVFVGEIGGTEEQRVGRWIAEHAGDLPVVAYVAGYTAPPRQADGPCRCHRAGGRRRWRDGRGQEGGSGGPRHLRRHQPQRDRPADDRPPRSLGDLLPDGEVVRGRCRDHEQVEDLVEAEPVGPRVRPAPQVHDPPDGVQHPPEHDQRGGPEVEALQHASERHHREPPDRQEGRRSRASGVRSAVRRRSPPRHPRRSRRRRGSRCATRPTGSGTPSG